MNFLRGFWDLWRVLWRALRRGLHLRRGLQWGLQQGLHLRWGWQRGLQLWRNLRRGLQGSLRRGLRWGLGVVGGGVFATAVGQEDAAADSALSVVLLYWQDLALVIIFAVAMILFWRVKRMLHAQQQSQQELQQTQQSQQEAHLAKLLGQMENLDARFQREIDGFAAEAGKRTAGSEKLLRAQEFAFKKSMEALQGRIDEIAETVQTLHKVLDSKDAEIARLQQSHDAVVWLKFVRRFVRVHQYLDDLRADDVRHEYLDKVKLRLDGALEECGVEVFVPPLASRYDEHPEGALDDSPEEIPCVDAADEFRIVEVIQNGYRLSDSGKIIVPAKVRIYAAAKPRQRGVTQIPPLA